MPERLVDVKIGERVAHTFPVTIKNPADQTNEDAFKAKALEAAANAKLAPVGESERLNAQIHVSRPGPLEPDPDPLGVLAETKEGLDQVVRELAYLSWEQAGRPQGREQEFWYQAQHQRFSERAYALWEREGRPEGRADEYWYRIRNFEEG